MKHYKMIAIEAALKSGLFIKRSIGRFGSISYKGRDNLVTDVDRRSEAIIIDTIRKAFPSHSILAEERGSLKTPSPYRWLIDPLDGTTNFAHSFPFFSVSVALERCGRLVLGVVYDPTRDELFCAEAGKGAFLNKKRIHVSSVKHLSGALLGTGFAYGRKKKIKNVVNFKNMLKRAQAIRRPGSAALDLCYVACARFDGFWEMDLHPWDSAAGTLMVREAGGCVTKFDGSPYTPYDKEVLAANRFIHRSMISVLYK